MTLYTVEYEEFRVAQLADGTRKVWFSVAEMFHPKQVDNAAKRSAARVEALVKRGEVEGDIRAVTVRIWENVA